MKKSVALSLVVLFIAGNAGLPVSVQAYEGVKKKGVLHNIADDRQVEKVGGLYEPEGLDKYLKRKFERVEAKIEELQAQMEGLKGQIGSIEEKLDSISDKLNENPGLT